MITVTDLELRAGARLLVEAASFRVGSGDRIGLVGRNGAGKTTTLRVLAGETLPHGGKVDRRGEIGYLPQDPRTGDLTVTARDRVLSARGLDEVLRGMEKAQIAMAEGATGTSEKAVREYGRLEDRFAALGGYAAEAEAARICSSLGLPDRVLPQPLSTLSGGQRRRIELARILFSDADTLLLDEPTNHLDADSIVWLRDFLKSHAGGLIVISHDVELLEATVNKVFHLDANRAELDVYNVGWKTYLQQRETDERRRKRERVNAEKKISQLTSQADRMRAKATKAKAAQSMLKRAERLASGLEEVRVRDRVAKLRFPDPAPCGRTPLTATGLSKSYGSLEVFTDVDLAIDRGSRVVVLGLNGAGKTTLLRLLAGVEPADTGEVHPGHGLQLGYYAQEHETLDTDQSVLDNIRAAAPDTVATWSCGGCSAPSCSPATPSTSSPARCPAARRPGWRLPVWSAAPRTCLLLDEPTNNLDPASREEVLRALATYRGAVVLVTHDEGAVEALQPDKVLLLPDGVEDNWSSDLSRPGRARMSLAERASEQRASRRGRLAANLGIAVAKAVGAAITGSSSMLAEAVALAGGQRQPGAAAASGASGAPGRRTRSIPSATAGTASSPRSWSRSCCSASVACSRSTRASTSSGIRTSWRARPSRSSSCCSRSGWSRCRSEPRSTSPRDCVQPGQSWCRLHPRDEESRAAGRAAGGLRRADRSGAGDGRRGADAGRPATPAGTASARWPSACCLPPSLSSSAGR